MTDDIRRMLDEAVVLMRNAAMILEQEGYHRNPEAMRKLADEMDKELEK